MTEPQPTVHPIDARVQQIAALLPFPVQLDATWAEHSSCRSTSDSVGEWTTHTTPQESTPTTPAGGSTSKAENAPTSPTWDSTPTHQRSPTGSPPPLSDSSAPPPAAPTTHEKREPPAQRLWKLPRVPALGSVSG